MDIPVDSWNPWAKLFYNEIEAMFRNNAVYVLSKVRIDRIIEIVNDLDRVKT